MTTATEGAPAPAAAPAGNPAAPAPQGNSPASAPAPAPSGTVVSGDPSQLNIGKEVPLTPAPAPAPTPLPENTGTGEFGDAGDPAMNVVYRFVENLGFKTTDSEIQHVLDSGDFTLLRAKLASMGDKAQGWQEYIGIAEKHFQNQAQKEQEKITSCQNAIHAAVGGQEQWLQIQAWASANANDEEKEIFNAMLNAGPVQAKIASRQLAEYYYAAHGNVKDPAEATSDRATTAGAGSNFALSPKEYVAAVQDLARKVGAGRIDDHPEYAKLKQRRAAWRG